MDVITKPLESGEVCDEITEFVVSEDEVISTYSTSDEGGFVFISYKRESYARP